jgi:protein CLEC16A
VLCPLTLPLSLSADFLFSNNQLNRILSHKFDFADEEILPYYITLLKTVSQRLSQHVIHFFYNKRARDFPLYTRSIRFFQHPERMIQTAVRTITLNIYRINDEDTHRFVVCGKSGTYFSRLCIQLTTMFATLATVNHGSSIGQNLVDEILDLLYYMSDIFSTGIKEISGLLARCLIDYTFMPFIVPLLGKIHDEVRWWW